MPLPLIIFLLIVAVGWMLLPPGDDDRPNGTGLAPA